MKLYVAILLVIVGLVAADPHVHDDGQPGCKTQQELTVKNWRNTWDPIRYWVCQQLGQAAVAAKCPEGEAWLDSQKQCVEWHNWQWETPSHPPSKP